MLGVRERQTLEREGRVGRALRDDGDAHRAVVVAPVVRVLVSTIMVQVSTIMVLVSTLMVLVSTMILLVRNGVGGTTR